MIIEGGRIAASIEMDFARCKLMRFAFSSEEIKKEKNPELEK